MPLIILGLIVIVGIVLYALVLYGQSGDEDSRPVRERYSHAFPPKEKSDQDDFDYEFEEENERSGECADGHTMYFPSDAELEKRKRNIH
jgi:hypothetical protein